MIKELIFSTKINRKFKINEHFIHKTLALSFTSQRSCFKKIFFQLILCRVGHHLADLHHLHLIHLLYDYLKIYSCTAKKFTTNIQIESNKMSELAREIFMFVCKQKVTLKAGIKFYSNSIQLNCIEN